MPHHETLAPVERLYARLADALLRTRPDPFGSPVTVAEIYQELVPYRLVRTEVGFDMNSAYEHALLRLLSGEAGCVRLEPPEASKEIGRELLKPNPNLSLYREYAGCDAWVRPPAARASAAAAHPADGPAATSPRSGAATEPAERPLAAYATFAFASELELEAFEPVTSRDEASAAAEAEAAPLDATSNVEAAAGEAMLSAEAIDDAIEETLVTGMPTRAPGVDETTSRAMPGSAPHCAFCDSPLPGRREARFCPYCGMDQTKRPCAACGEILEPGWVYCIACGVSAP
jgi:hypothetical protein